MTNAEPNNTHTARTLLRERYLERREKNAHYSTRAFARDLGMSPAYLSLVFSGKRPLSIKQAMKIVAALELKSDDADAFLELVVLEAAGSSSRYVRKKLAQARSHDDLKVSFIDLEVDRFRVISQWFHLPILDLISTRGFKEDPVWIARRLGISPVDARDAVERLVRLGLMEINSKGKWTKTNAHIFFPPQKTDGSVRSFHQQMIAKAGDELAKVSPEDFSKRNISASTMATSPERIEEAKKIITRFQKELSDYLTEGPCTEVYQLNVQLFPLTKTKAEAV